MWIFELPCLHQNGNAAFSWFLQEATTFQLSLSTHVPLSAYELSLSTAMELSIRWSFHPLMALSVDALAVEALSVDALIRWWMLSVEALETSVEALFLIRWRPLIYQLILLHLYKITRHEIFTISPPIYISTSSQHDW